MTEYLMSRVV